MTREGFANDLDGITALTIALTPSDVSIAVALGDVGPANAPFRIRIEEELVLVTSTGASPWTVLARGIEGSQPAAHPNGAPVAVVLTAVGLVTAIEDRLRTPLPGEALGAPAARFASVSTEALDLPVTPSTLLGRGVTPGSVEEVQLGTGLAMAGNTLSAPPVAPPAVTPSHLLGRGTTPGTTEEIALGTGLSMAGATLNAAGGAALPTAPVGQVLVSQGDGVAPVFSDTATLGRLTLQKTAGGVVLIDNGQPADQRRWHIWPLTGGYLCFDMETDAGALATRVFYLNRANGQIVTAGAISAQVYIANARIDLTEVPYAAVVSAPVGSLANINDSTVNTIGSVIAGGGSFHVFARRNVTNWTVIGV